MTTPIKPGQQNVSNETADAILMAAAGLGLFPREKNVKTLTEASALESALAHMQRKQHLVRFATEKDLPAMVALERRCWAIHLCTSPDEIRNRILRYPAGQLVLEMHGAVCGVIYSQRIHALEELNGMTSDRVWQLHADEAPILQLLAVNILPECQQMNLGDQLLEFMLQRASVMKGVQSVAAVTLCKRYSQHRQYAFQEYVRWRTQHGKLHDPILRFHELHGATIQYAIANYRPNDKENDGYGVLATYDLQQRQRDEIVTSDTTASNTPPSQRLQLSDIQQKVMETIRGLLGVNEQTDFTITRPLMEMGLNSADLISLGEAIRFEYQIDLESTFFFQYNTAEKIALYLSERVCRKTNQENTIPVSYTSSAISEHGSPSMTPAQLSTRAEDVAIIGIGCRLPGGIHNPEQLWEFLIQGRDAITQLPAERWQWPAGTDPGRSHPGIDRGGFLDEIARFDARFFRITPREAQLMDPQQRILLELTWETLEDAGSPPNTLIGTRTGVFVGASGSDYALLLQKSSGGDMDAHAGTGGAASILANRISYFYDLRGPSLLIDTACSSSLVAVHQAIRSLRSGECEQALVAGINIMCHPGTTIAYYKAGMLAKDGRCKTFDKEANGYVRSEGAVMVLLKPLAHALADGNFVYSVIKGSAISHGGQASGLTVPNPEQQSALILDAWHDAGASLHTAGYLEAHGTGTSLGDPIEVKAILDTFRGAESSDQGKPMRCGIGSIKTNLGHLEAAAGLAGLVKAALSLNHALVPKHRNFRELNPGISLSDSPLFIVEENMSLEEPDSGLPRRAGVSSFGSGGTYAHVVLEEFRQDPLLPPNSIASGPWLFTLSARTAERLHAHAAQLSTYLKSRGATLGENALQAIAFTLQTGREALEVRLALTASSVNDLIGKLDRFCAGEHAIEGLYYSDTKDAPTAMKILAEAARGSVLVHDALRDKDFSRIGALWSAGASIEWQALYAGYRGEKCFLPSYPFASDHYWVDPRSDADTMAPIKTDGNLHPLLDSNISTLAEQKFRKRLRRGQRFIKDHVVHGRTILPGVAHLEMARAAAELSVGRPVRVVKNVIWGRPLVVEGDSKDIVIALRPETHGISFEVRAEGDDAVYSRGKIEANDGRPERHLHPAAFDLKAIRERNKIRKTRQEIFRHLENLGFEYGPSFQLTNELISGEAEALVSLVPSPCQKDSSECLCEWSPELVDSAIRTPFLIGLEQNSYNDRLRVPFSLGKVEAFSSLDNARYAYARIVQNGADGDYVSHVSILDENGVELLLFENLLNKTFRQRSAVSGQEATQTPSTALSTVVESSNKVLQKSSDAQSNASTRSLSSQSQVQTGTDNQLFDAVVSYLKQKISTATKAPVASIGTREPLSSYGIDSVIIMELNRSLEADFDPLPGTLFFQFGTVQDLAKYFISNHADRLGAVLGNRQYSQPIAPVDLLQQPQPLSRTEISKDASASFRKSNIEWKHQTASNYRPEIAIIGLSGRYPKASSVDRFWENLKLGVDGIEEIPAARWDYRKYYSPKVKKPGMTNSKWGGFIENVDKFDAAFFNISPREADYMDPQQRLFLEAAWAACEDAGYSWERTRNLDQLPRENSVGVFVGLMYDDYHFFERQISTSYWNSFVANRVSHFFNFRGPSMTVDTACSSSLTTIYMACESLRNGHSYAAIAGGTNLSIHPRKYARLSQLNMLSSEGKCKSFGKDGNGYVPGEGVGAVLLKRLEDAVRDGDHIYAIIKGGALNHGGKTNGFTVPNPNAQAELIAAAMQDSGVSPRTISYIEAHGTGTELGDPIEITGLSNAFRKHTADRQFCSIGSVKSNIGHLEGAAGIAAVTKVVLQLQHQQQVPSLHAQVTNPLIDFQNSPFTVVQELTEWKRPLIQEPGGAREYPRRAGVSSFGAGGANAHLILEEYIEENEEHSNQIGAVSGRLPALVPLSAKTQERLRAYVLKLLEFCQGQQANLHLDRMAYTLQTGRQPMEWRVAFVASDLRELSARMEAFVAEKDTAGCYHNHVRRGNELANVFGTDEELEEAISKWMTKWKVDRLAQLWVQGVEINWEKMYGNRHPRRMSLPTYPFDGERYWVPAENEAEAGEAARQIETATQAIERSEAVSVPSDLLTFREEWKPEPLIPGLPTMASVRVVYFGLEMHPAESFAAALQSQGIDAAVVRVEAGESFARLDCNRYQLHPAKQQEYKLLFDTLERDGFQDYVIVYRWAYGQEADGIRRIYELVSAIGHRRRISRLVLTGLIKDDIASCYDFSWIGYERSLKLMIPGLSCTLLYCEDAALADETLIREMGASGVVRYRAGERFRLAIAETQVKAGPPQSLKKHGVYLITGGCGGLGELFAEHLAKTYEARLVLVGRRVEDDAIRHKLSRLGKTGSTAIYCSADVSDLAAMHSIIEQAKGRFGRIDGIIHAAGIGPSRTIFDKQWNDFHTVLQPKLAGSIAVDEATRGLNLDFICYFSSSSAVLGDFGSCDYSIGNRFQMAFGSYCQLQSEKAGRRCKNIVINWPLWRDGGMTVGDQQQTEMYLKSSGQRYLECDEGLRIWEQILNSGNEQTLLFAGDTARITRSLARLYGLPELVITQTPRVDSAPLSSIVGDKHSSTNADRPSSPAQTPLPIRERIAADIRATISRVLNLQEESLEDDVTWGDFGFDSITLGELGRLVSDLFQIEIAPSLFFSYSTIEKFCSYLIHEHGTLLQNHYKDTGQTEMVKQSDAEMSMKSVPPPDTQPTQETRVQPVQNGDSPIAIIGLAGRFPGANSAEELWAALASGKTMLTEIPDDRWNWREYFLGSGDSRNKIATNRGGFLEDVTAFDPLFFEISPREAELMEPRQRLLLQEAWHAFEDAGYVGKKLRGTSCGVFIGVEEGDHAYLAKHQGLAPGNHNAMLAARISYYLDLRGPNLAINTACSSGLVALHLACQALRSGESEMALAGGINLLLSPAAYLMLSSMGMLSPDGQCRPFEQRAKGMVPAEAVGAVVLKPLATALKDRDHIYAVIRGSGTNYDGRTSGITAPNALSQAALLEEIFARYCIDPANLQLVIGHSVGSPLGDPIEVQALSQSIRKHSDARQFCALTSIKSLVGHSFAASGIVNLIAMCMAIKHETIPAIHCEQPSTQLDLVNSPFYLSQGDAAWKADGSARPRTGLVGATGMSGTNAFVVLEEPPSQPARHAKPVNRPERDILVALSAKTPSALEQSASNLRKFLMEQSSAELADVAYTLQAAREPMTYRVVFPVRDTMELIGRLEGFVWSDLSCDKCFTGQVKRRNQITLSCDDETLQKAIRTWKSDGKGESLAQLWTKGADFDWDLLHDDMKPKRISLPTYPFVRRHFGILPGVSGPVTSGDGAASSSSKKVDATPAIKTRKRICVVGAGPSGLVMAKSLKEEGHEAVIYEKQNTLGGLWVLQPHKSGGAYKKTRFQTSKYTSVFSDFFPDDITSTFYSVGEVKRYLDRYANHFKLQELIHYHTEVLSVQQSGSKWKVVVREAGVEREDEFEGVAMCHGMFWKQRIPVFPGFASFQGTSFHSGRYYDNSVFAGKRVLVIGNGVSGMDIAEEASEVADRVFWSVRSLKLVLPRMVGFVPNDCHSIASLLLPSNRAYDVERLRHSVPDYLQLYKRSGLLPSRRDLERNPTIHINDNVVKLVAEGKIQVCPGVASFEGRSCRFADQTSAEVDVVVFCTGYDSTLCEYLPGIQPRDFSMGIFYQRNPTLVNALGQLPIAFSGSFFFCEMVARWYAQVLSGKYRLTEAELQHRITPGKRAVIGPVAGVLFGLKLGLFPSPQREFKEFWKLLNYPAFPMMYRLRGEHSDKQAHAVLEECRKRAFVKTDEHDSQLKELKHRILAGLDAPVLEQLLASGEITPNDYSGAQLQRDNPLRLDWDMQYIQQKHAPAAFADFTNVASEQERWQLESQDLFEQIKAGDLDADQLVAALSPQECV